jgi:hypothetical protein
MSLLNLNFGLLGSPRMNVNTPGINPDAQMLGAGLQQPIGGYGQPTVPMTIPTMPLPQPQQPTTFAQRLGDIRQRLMDYSIGRNMAGKASLDPSSGDQGYVNAMGFQNMQNQARARSDLARQLENQRINNMYKQALTQNLQPRTKFQDIAGGAFTRKINPDGTSEIVENPDIANYLQQLAETKRLSATGGLTKTQIKRDELFLKDYDPAKFAQSQKNIAILETAYKDIDPTDDFQASGLPYQQFPDNDLLQTGARIFGEGARREDIEQRIRSVTQESLRALLGGQFAEREGERIIRNAYNPALPEEFNRARLKTTIDTLKRVEAEQRARINHFEKFQTLAGYKNANLDLEEVMRNVDKAYEQTEMYKKEQDYLKKQDKRGDDLVNKYSE